MDSAKKHRLNEISHFPRLEDLRLIMNAAVQWRGSTIELPWRSAKTGKLYTISGLVDPTTRDMIWTLFLGEGAAATAVWSTGFTDLEMLVDVMVLSLPDETERTNMPFEVAPGAARPLPGAQVPYPPGYPPPGQHYPPHTSGSYPVAPGYPPPYPQGYQPHPNYPPPNYAVPPNYPPPGYPPYPPAYPPAYPQPPQQPAFAQPQPPAPMAPAPAAAPAPSESKAKPVPAKEEQAPLSLKPDAELLRKRSNVKLGEFFVQADLIPARTLEAALFLQDLVKGNVLTTSQAAEALARAHNRGGTLESNIFLAKPKPLDGPRITLPLGQIMVEAGLLSPDALEAALNLQDAARTGVLSAEEALNAFVKDTYKKDVPTGQAAAPSAKGAESEPSVRLLLKAGLVTTQDIQVAQKVEIKHGGSTLNILFAAGKIEQTVMDAASELVTLMQQQKLKEEQAVMAIDYCQRSRVALKEALKELRWSV